MNLQPIDIDPALGPISEKATDWTQAAGRAAKSIDCFDYVPSSPELLHAFLSVIPGKSYCEWGSGIGIGVGIAAMLGFEATGIEIDTGLAKRSTQLLDQFEINAKIVCDSYHEVVNHADVIFVYCWPGQANAVRERICSTMQRGTWILIADGAERLSPYFLC